jgi:uncharacterized protein (TIGR03437 family)
MRVTKLAAAVLGLASIAAAAPRLSLNTNTVGPITIVTGTNGPAQTVQAGNAGDGSLSLTATTSASWLTASVGAQGSCSANGGNCYAITISLNTSSLAGGTYTEYVTLTDPNAVDSPQDIAVTVNTTGVPSSITSYVTPAPSATSTTVFDVFTTGTGVKGTAATTSGGNWLTFLSGQSGLITSPAPWLIQTAAQSGQAPGTYTGTVTITGSSASSDNKVINVTMNVTTAPIIPPVTNNAIRLTASPAAGTQYSVVNVANIGQGSLAVTAAATTAKWLTATVSGGNALLIAADPTGMATGVYSGTVTISSNAANNSQVAIPVQLNVIAAGTPLISSGGLVNVATYAQEGVTPGGIVAIYGNEFAAAGTFATNSSLPLATTLGSAQVLFNGTTVPIYFVSPSQINFQVPYSATPGSVASVQVVANGKTGNLRSLTIGNAPRLLYFLSFIQGNYGVIVNGTDGSLTLPTGTVVPGFVTHPAKPGDVIVIYGIAFGQTTPAAKEGAAANTGQNGALQTLTNVQATFGGGFLGRATTTDASFAGLTPTAAGLYQANVKIPDDTPLGAMVPVTVVVKGVLSNPVYLAITATGK